MSNFLLDHFPMVILHHLLIYFSLEDIIFSLLNISPYLNHIIRSYSNYRLNFQSSHRSRFDLICQHVFPDQIKVLVLSDDKDTPGQSELFLSYFQTEQLINLQYLTLIEIEKKSSRTILIHLNKLKHLRGLSLKLQSTKSLSLPLSNLRYLELYQCELDQLQQICSTTPYLKTLNVLIIHQKSDFDFHCQLDHLTRLSIKINGSPVSMNEMKEFLRNFPRLKHLELSTKCHIDLIDGRQWSLLAKNFITLKFIFQIRIDSPSTTLDTFRTLFWLKEKRWFVAYKNEYLYTIPCSMYEHIDEHFRPPIYTTLLKTSRFYDHITKLTLKYDLLVTCHRLNNITTLEIGYENISIEILSAIVKFNKVENFTLSSLMNTSTIKFFINNMPRLQCLSIDTLMSETDYDIFQHFRYQFWDFLKKIKHLKFDFIRSLTISKYHIIEDSYTIHRLSKHFPYTERLELSIGRIDNIKQTIDSFQNLSSVTFMLKFDANDQLIENYIQQSFFSSSKYRLNHSSLHLWIAKQEKIVLKKNPAETREYIWNWLNYTLCQPSVVGIIISFILINLLINIWFCMWTYLFSDSLIRTALMFQILKPNSFGIMQEFRIISPKNFDRRLVYIFGYSFVWSFIVIAYILFQQSEQILDNNNNNEQINDFDDRLLLLFIHPQSILMSSLGCLICFVAGTNMYQFCAWIITLILYCIIGLCVCLSKIFFVKFVL